MYQDRICTYQVHVLNTYMYVSSLHVYTVPNRPYVLCAGLDETDKAGKKERREGCVM